MSATEYVRISKKRGKYGRKAKVAGTASPHMVVTRFAGKFADRSRRYVVTHVPTGHQLNPFAFDTVRAAQKAVRLLLAQSASFNWGRAESQYPERLARMWENAALDAGGIRWWTAPR